MTNKKSKGYTKSKIDLMKVFTDMQNCNSPIFKNPKEPLDKWIVRKTEEQVYHETNRHV